MSRLKDVYGDLRKEMTATFDRKDMVAVVTGGKAAEYANLKHLHVGSPPSDVSDLGEATDLDELLAMGSSQGPQTHPGTSRLAGVMRASALVVNDCTIDEK